jgi:hypothetical protein
MALSPFDFIQKASGLNPQAARIVIIIPLLCSGIAIAYSFIKDENPARILLFSVIVIVGMIVIFALSAMGTDGPIGQYAKPLVRTVIFTFCATVMTLFASWSTHCPRPLRCLLSFDDCPPRPACVVSGLFSTDLALKVEPAAVPATASASASAPAPTLRPSSMSVIAGSVSSTAMIVNPPGTPLPTPPPAINRAQFRFYVQFAGYARGEVTSGEHVLSAMGWVQRYAAERTSDAMGFNEVRIRSNDERKAAEQFIQDLATTGGPFRKAARIRLLPDISAGNIEVWISK